MEPEVPGAKRRGRARLPKLEGGDAVRVYAINENAKARAGRGRGRGAKPPRAEAREREELLNAGVTLLGMMKKRRAAERLAAGWTNPGEGIWLPPGWTATRPDEPPPVDPPSP